ncbi:MAG TPA: hypothetical protein VFZ22_03745 [Pyrinomonadaceae bacterium]|nr:hypothetical protein [Pyrinomonadaceae bacterium]
MKKLAVRLLVAVVTLSLGIGLAVYLKRRAHQKRCSGSSYFAAPLFAEGNDRKSEFLRRYLAAQQEPGFSCLDEKIEAYRVLYLPAFDYATSVRIWRDGDQYLMTIKQLEDEWTPLDHADKPARIRLNTTRPLTALEWTHFKEQLVTANFWSMPLADPNTIGLDGVSCTLEGKRGGRYHVVFRWGDEPGFMDACRFLLQLAKVERKHPR